MTDPAEIRAEGRRLLHVQRASNPLDGAEPYWEFRDFVVEHADVLLADPAPVGLTKAERADVEDHRIYDPEHPLLAIIDRLSAAPRAEREALEAWQPKPGDRVLFIEDGNYVTGTVEPWPNNQASSTSHWGVKGDLGGMHTGPDPVGKWIWPMSWLADLIDALAAPAPAESREGERVPEGWRVEWVPQSTPRPGSSRSETMTAIGWFLPRLVPVSPSVDPEEG